MLQNTNTNCYKVVYFVSSICIQLSFAISCDRRKVGIFVSSCSDDIHKMKRVETIENRICREELKESLGMNFFSPFQPEREFKVYKSCKCSQIICSRVH